MPRTKATVEPNQERIGTRASNTNTHPGTAAKEALRSYRPKEVIQREKDMKAEHQMEKEQKQLADEARKAAGEERLAQLDEEDVAAVAAAQSKYPRQRNRGKGKINVPEKASVVNKGKRQKAAQEKMVAALQPSDEGSMQEDKTADASEEATRRGKSTELPAKRPRPRPTQKTIQATQPTPSDVQSHGDLEDTDVEEATPPSKKAKVGNRRKRQPLRCTESVIFEDATPSKPTTLKDDTLMLSDNASEAPMEVDSDEDNATPRPAKENRGTKHGSEVSDDDMEEEAFKTPLTLKTRKRTYAMATKNILDDEGVSENEGGKVKSKGRIQKREKNMRGRSKGERMAGKEHAAVSQPADNKKKPFHSDSTSRAASKPLVTSGSNRSSRPPAGSEMTDHVSRSQRECSVIPNMFAVAPHTTSSNNAVAAKETTTAPLPKKKKTVKTVAKEPETQEDSESEPERTIGGMQSDEDDTLEHEVALSSPVKGSEQRKSTKDMVQVKAKGKKQCKKKPTVDDLPDGANENDAWGDVVIPTFIKLVLAGDNSWMYREVDIKPLLQKVWNHTYGDRISFEIKKGTVPYELAYQKLCQYRNAYASKALEVVFTYYRINRDTNASLPQDKEPIADWAHQLKVSQDFVYKGAERKKPKKSGAMEHTLILQTFSAHFSTNTVSPVQPPRGLEIGKPYCGLALATAVVERALALFSQQQIVRKTSGNSKISRLVVVRSVNLETGSESTVGTDFSKDNWGLETSQYLTSIKCFPSERFDKIFDNARQLSRTAGKRQDTESITTTGGKSSQGSFWECLLSESESSGEDDEEDAQAGSDMDSEVNDDGNGLATNGE